MSLMYMRLSLKQKKTVSYANETLSYANETVYYANESTVIRILHHGHNLQVQHESAALLPL